MADSVKIKIVGDDSQYRSTLGSLAGTTKSVLSSTGSVIKGMLGAQVITRGLSMLTNGFRSARDAGMSFESSMSNVAAISGATGSELDKLTAKAKEMGATTMFSASQAGEAFGYMAMAGWKTEEMLAGIDGVMKLAASSGEDLGTVSDIVTDAITALGMEAGDAGHFANVLAAAASNSNTNVSMMGETFKYVAPLAGALGYNAEDLSVAIGLMANSGIKGSQAGTALRGTLTRLSKPTKESATAMSQLGISATNADGTMKPLNQLLVEMRTAFDGLSASQKAQYAAMIAGQEGMSGFLAMVNASDTDFNKLTAAINNCSDAADKMSSIQMDNLQGDVRIFQSALEGIQISLFESSNGMLRNAVQAGSGILTAIQEGFNKNGLSGMADALLAQIPVMLPKVTKGISTLLSGLSKKLPDMLKGLLSSLPDILGNVFELAPQLLDGMFQAVSAGLDQLISMLPQLLPKLAVGLWDLAKSALMGVGTLAGGLLDTLLGVDVKHTEYDAGTPINVEAAAEVEVDWQSAQDKIDQEYTDFVSYLKGYGLSTEQIVQILAFTGTEEELRAWLDENFPNLDQAVKDTIVSKFTAGSGEKTALAELFEGLDGYGITPEQLAYILLQQVTDPGFDLGQYLANEFPDLGEAERFAIITALANHGTSLSSVVTSLTGFGIKPSDIADILLHELQNPDQPLGDYLAEKFPNLTDEARAAIEKALQGADGSPIMQSIVSELEGYGLTMDDIAKLLFAWSNDENFDIDTYLSTAFPDLKEPVKNAIKAALGIGEDGAGLGQQLVADLQGLGISNEDIVKIITWKAEGDETSIQSLLEEKYSGIKGEAITALTNAWNADTTGAGSMTSGVEGTSVGFITQLIVDMFTNGIDESSTSIDSAITVAKGVISQKKQDIIDLINTGVLSESETQDAYSALDTLSQYETAIEDYATTYASASTADCKTAAEDVLALADTVDTVTGRILSASDRLKTAGGQRYNYAMQGYKLSDEDAALAMGWIVNERERRRQEAAAEKQKDIDAKINYNEVEKKYETALAEADATARQQLWNFLLTQSEVTLPDNVGFAAMLDSVWDQLTGTITENGLITQSDVQEILENAGYGPDMIAQAMSTLFGEQTFSKVDLSESGLGEGVPFLVNSILDPLFADGPQTEEQVRQALEGQFDTDIIEAVVSSLVPSDMSLEDLDYESLIGNIDFGTMGDYMAKAIEGGLVEGVTSTDGLDINKLLLAWVAEYGTKPTTPPEPTPVTVPVEPEPEITEDTNIAEDVAEALTDASTNSGEGNGIEVDADISVGAGTVDASGAESAVSEAGEQVSASYASGLESGKSEVSAAASTLPGAASGAVSRAGTGQMVSAGSNMASGVASGISSGRSRVIQAALSLAQAAAQAIREALQIRSPSRVMMSLGLFTGEGFAEGLESSLTHAVASARGIVGAMTLRPGMDFSGLSGSLSDTMQGYAEAESMRPVVLSVNGRQLAAVTQEDTAIIANRRNRQISLGYGK